jgi:hypothetical protein
MQPVEDDGFHLPRVSQKLMSRFKSLAKSMTEVIPAVHVGQVVYHLQEYHNNKQLHVSYADKRIDVLIN